MALRVAGDLAQFVSFDSAFFSLDNFVGVDQFKELVDFLIESLLILGNSSIEDPVGRMILVKNGVNRFRERRTFVDALKWFDRTDV